MAGKVLTVAECEAVLIEARAAYEEAHRKAESASREETAARNRLNDAQKTFDAVVTAIKSDSPWNTHWHDERKVMRSI